MFRFFIIISIVFAFAATSLYATLINVPDDFETIQGGINEAEDGDTVLVAPGEYVENINFDGKNILLTSFFAITNNPQHIAATVIDGDQNGSVVTIANGEQAAVVLGFTITNGSANRGGGIYIGDQSRATLINLSIFNNIASTGGGVGCDTESNVVFDNCVISANLAGDHEGAGSAGGIWGDNSNVIINQCLITENYAGGVGGGAEFISVSEATIINSTFSDNETGDFGGSISLHSGSTVIITSSILRGGIPQELSSDPRAGQNFIVVQYSDIEGGEDEIDLNDNAQVNYGEGNIDEDPLFADAENDDFNLTADSPCIDAGDPEAAQDPDGTRADMGAFYFHQEQEGEPPNITYYLYFGTYIPFQGPGPVLRITPLGENVRAGELFTIPSYDLANYNLGDSFQIYMDAIAGTTIEIEEGAIEDDIEIHLVLNNLLISVDENEQAQFHGIYSPDQNLQDLIWMFADYQVWTADEDSTWINEDEHFEFLNDLNMVISVPIDEEFLGMMEAMNLDYNLLGAAFWLPAQEAWDEAGIAGAAIEFGEETWFRIRVSHLSQIVGGPQGVFGRSRTMPLNEGWNLISLNFTPAEYLWAEGYGDDDAGADVIRLFDQLQIGDDENIIWQVKDENGDFYQPGAGFNNIPYWSVTEGYRVKATEDEFAVWFGDRVPSDADVPLEEGWNYIAYFPEYDLDASAGDFYALSPIIDEVLLAKDVNGRFMLPRVDFSNMEPWRETQGYQVKVSADVVLNYPEQGDEEDFASRGFAEIPVGDRHWLKQDLTTSNMSVLVNSVAGIQTKYGTEIAAFNTAGAMVGSGVLDIDGRCGLAVWGDDPSTEHVEGLREGEAFELRLWISGVEADLTTSTLVEGKLTYEADGLLIVDTEAEIVIPMDYFLSGGYPNPFNSVTRLNYGLPESGLVSISVYDLTGRLVQQLLNHQQVAGYHSVTWNAKSASSGLYIVRMTAEGFSKVQKIVLTK